MSHEEGEDDYLIDNESKQNKVIDDRNPDDEIAEEYNKNLDEDEEE